MSLEETKKLLRIHRIRPNKLLGQNFIIEPILYEKLCTYASLTALDVVLDVGAGFGFLSRFLAKKCKAVIAVEKDPQIAKVLCEQVKNIENVKVIEGDVLKIALPKFNKVVAAPPYYLSSNLIPWIFEHEVNCAVLVLQQEFADRLVASVGSEDYGWLTVVTYRLANVELLYSVPRNMFYPQPEVDSTIVNLSSWSKKPFLIMDEMFFTRMVKWLFTQRNKKLAKAITPFFKNNLNLSKQDAERMASSLPFAEKRARELSPKDFGELANALNR
jgi:16S rRNA (adenine1518-N6/adenine1519-N6)-dimethyltransferase